MISCAILGRGPDWHADQPEVRSVTNGGKPAWFVQRRAKDAFGKAYLYEADGYDRKRMRVLKGAYRKYELVGSIRGAILARLEWQLWRSALESLQETLSAQIKGHSLLAFAPTRAPWTPMKKSDKFVQVLENNQ